MWNFTATMNVCGTQQRPATRSQMRQAALEKIVAEMDMEDFTLADARQKIKSLRNTYGQELNK